MEKPGTQQVAGQQSKGGGVAVRDGKAERNEAEITYSYIRRKLNRVGEFEMKSIQVNDLDRTTDDLLSHIRVVHNEVLSTTEALTRRVESAKTDTFMGICRLQQDVKLGITWHQKILGHLEGMKDMHQATQGQGDRIEKKLSTSLERQQLLLDVGADSLPAKSRSDGGLVRESSSGPIAEHGEKLDALTTSVRGLQGQFDVLTVQLQKSGARDEKLLEALAGILFLGGRVLVVLGLLLLVFL